MRPGKKLSGAICALGMGAALIVTSALTGCGLPAAPQPPSLELPEPVTDLAASRTGDVVTLNWTMPERDTSRVALKDEIATKICRQEAVSGCETVSTVRFAPGASGTFTETLPQTFASGDPRALNYQVELVNKHGRSAGQSNTATVLAGQAPTAVNRLTAEMQRDGVALHWTPGPQERYATQIRLERTLVSAQPAKPAQGPLSPPVEAAKQNLLVPAGGARGGALDSDIRFGEVYEYRAQRVAKVTVQGKELELEGPLSSPIRVDAQNTFPPAVPTGLAAVSNPGASGASASIDLSWQPNADANIAGYAVYRREAGTGGIWQRISGVQPVVGPGFHDPNVQAGHSYEYAVTGIGQNGRESGKSEMAQETIPAE